MNKFTKLVKTLKNGCSDTIDVSVPDKEFQAVYYQAYTDGSNSMQDGIYEKETYSVQQFDAFLKRKVKDGYSEIKQDADNAPDALSEDPENGDGSDKRAED
jgi:hypothetical protein